jgi:hypothetical protein
MTHTHEHAHGTTDQTTAQWEYCLQTVKCEDLADFMGRVVNDMGRQGWEMLTAAPVSRNNTKIGYYVGGYTTRFEMIFKRRLPSGERP